MSFRWICRALINDLLFETWLTSTFLVRVSYHNLISHLRRHGKQAEFSNRDVGRIRFPFPISLTVFHLFLTPIVLIIFPILAAILRQVHSQHPPQPLPDALQRCVEPFYTSELINQTKIIISHDTLLTKLIEMVVGDDAVEAVTFGNVIYVCDPKVMSKSRAHVHELFRHEIVHVAQYQRAGCRAAFLSLYIASLFRSFFIFIFRKYAAREISLDLVDEVYETIDWEREAYFLEKRENLKRIRWS